MKMWSKLLLLLSLISAEAAANSKTPYEVLGVSSSSTEAEIRKAYLKLAKRYHPDVNPNDQEAERKMREINEAYGILSERDKRSTEAKSQADEIGEIYSNNKWRYDASTKRFYDNRTRMWIAWDNVWNSFYSAEGWLFYPSDGTYLSTDLAASWNPDNGRGWHRRTSNFGDHYIQIDPKTGFALSVRYEPRTVSDASYIFDELFNPVNLLDQKADRGNRAELLKQVLELPWTDAQKADYAERARAHIQIMKHRDMQINFATDHIYFNSLMEAILDNPQTREMPEIVQIFVRDLPRYREELIKELLLKDTWFYHPNASSWLSELFSTENGMRLYIKRIFASNLELKQSVAQLERFYWLMIRTGMPADAIHGLIHALGSSGSNGFEAFRERLLDVAALKQFSELIASVDLKHTESLEVFLRWYKKYEPGRSAVFARALEMPGTERSDYWRLTADRRENKFHEREYEASKRRSTKLRLSFLEQNLPERVTAPSAAPNATCENLLTKR